MSRAAPDAGSRPRRSVLFVPGNHQRAQEKAHTLPADCLIFDLEDAVAPEEKQAARTAVINQLSSADYGKKEIIVRINDPSDKTGQADLAALKAVITGKHGSGPDAILTPKVKTPEDLPALPSGVELWVMIETARAVQNCAAIADHPDVRCLVAGTNDLTKEMGLRGHFGLAGRAGLVHALSTMTVSARASGIVALDGVFNDIGNISALRQECEQGAAFGFDGKTLIHPGQIQTANEVFAPTDEELAEAKAIIDAFDAPENAGKGVIKVHGKMTERLHLEQARHIVAIGHAIQELEAGK